MTEEEWQTRSPDAWREIVKETLCDLVADFLWYDRREDETLTREGMARLFAEGIITARACPDYFLASLQRRI